MKYELNGMIYEVIINRKNNKNLYIRVKSNLKIYVSCNYFTTKAMVISILDKNSCAIQGMINKVSKENEDSNKFFYLGKTYNIVFDEEIDNVKIIDNKILTKDKKMLDRWYDNEIIRIFDERYVYVFNHYKENIKSPILKIRNMKTRWGVYNRKNHTITLNSKLIEYDIEKIDYVIIHELSHILNFNHSRKFWALVSKYCPNYKEIRKEMK